MAGGLAWRKRFGVLIPSTNTVVEPDFQRLSVPGVTAHFSRIDVPDGRQDSDDRFVAVIDRMNEGTMAALRILKQAQPDYIVMALSAPTFLGGAVGSRGYADRIRDAAGTGVATGSEAVARALRCFGITRIGILTPYQQIGDERVAKFFSESGFEIAAMKGLKVATAFDISQTDDGHILEALRELSTPSVQALVQVGTDLSMVALADEAERWLAKPVIAINAALWWMALRDNGITDLIYESGRLLREF
jgi:maleate isomerase